MAVRHAQNATEQPACMMACVWLLLPPCNMQPHSTLQHGTRTALFTSRRHMYLRGVWHGENCFVAFTTAWAVVHLYLCLLASGVGVCLCSPGIWHLQAVSLCSRGIRRVQASGHWVVVFLQTLSAFLGNQGMEPSHAWQLGGAWAGGGQAPALAVLGVCVFGRSRRLCVVTTVRVRQP